ncbi:MAG: hypothetical protein ACRBG0_02475 [Lewinella sp.]|jgi:hypothetical protein|uniref:hypothetical protein n=1 Tax=Lewinella sp. TaxID=2004506 RepID=UPI003D6B788A
MPREFSKLTEAEKQHMVDAIPLITILVAGADGKMDDNELEWAEKVTKIRSYDHASKLNDYYKLVSDHFASRINEMVIRLPKETAERTQVISEELAKLNPILHKLDAFDAAIYYKNFRTFAEHVAEASGGLLGFASVGPEERAVIELPMLEVFE